MAILIEEEKKKINWFALLGILIVVGILFAAVYYLFFINPSSIEIIVPHSLKNLEQVDQIKFNPAEILDNPVLRNLSPKAAPITPEPAFNSNPFQ